MPNSNNSGNGVAQGSSIAINTQPATPFASSGVNDDAMTEIFNAMEYGDYNNRDRDNDRIASGSSYMDEDPAHKMFLGGLPNHEIHQSKASPIDSLPGIQKQNNALAVPVAAARDIDTDNKIMIGLSGEEVDETNDEWMKFIHQEPLHFSEESVHGNGSQRVQSEEASEPKNHTQHNTEHERAQSEESLQQQSLDQVSQQNIGEELHESEESEQGQPEPEISALPVSEETIDVDFESGALEQHVLAEDEAEQESDSAQDLEQIDFESTGDETENSTREGSEEDAEDDSDQDIEQAGGYMSDDEDLDRFFPQPDIPQSGTAEDPISLPDSPVLGWQPPYAPRSVQSQITGHMPQYLPMSANPAEQAFGNAALPFVAQPNRTTVPPNPVIAPFVVPAPIPPPVVPYWSAFVTLTPAAIANPGGWAAAHALIARTPFRSQCSDGPYSTRSSLGRIKGDFLVVVRNAFIPKYVREYHPGLAVPNSHNGQNHWHNARPPWEQDRIRRYVQRHVEAQLPNDVKAEVQRLRYNTPTTAIGGGLNVGPNLGLVGGVNGMSNHLTNGLNGGLSGGLYSMGGATGSAHNGWLSGGVSDLSNASGGRANPPTTISHGQKRNRNQSRQEVGESTEADLQNLPRARTLDGSDHGLRMGPGEDVDSVQHRDIGYPRSGNAQRRPRAVPQAFLSPFEGDAAADASPQQNYTPSAYLSSYNNPNRQAEYSARLAQGSSRQNYNLAPTSNDPWIILQDESDFSNGSYGTWVPENGGYASPYAQQILAMGYSASGPLARTDSAQPVPNHNLQTQQSQYHLGYSFDENSLNQSQNWDASFGNWDRFSGHNPGTAGDWMTVGGSHQGNQQTAYLMEDSSMNGFGGDWADVLQTNMRGSKRKSFHDEDNDDLAQNEPPASKFRKTR